MPDLMTLEAARPLCPGRRNTTTIFYGERPPCLERLSSRVDGWHCPKHGVVLVVEYVAVP